MDWMLDEKINLYQICNQAKWNRHNAIEALTRTGVEKTDATAFIDFAFNEYAIENGGFVDVNSFDLLTDEQWDRVDWR